VRSIVCRYETAEALAAALSSPDRELAVMRRPRTQNASEAPASSRGASDGEWVLAIVELTGRATAAAARVRRFGERSALVFEPRDWKRIRSLLEETPSTDRSPEVPRRSNAPLSKMGSSFPRKLGDGNGARILLVDDDVEVRDVVGAMLEAVGFEIASAATGEDGLKELEARAIDLVVLDWTLPGMSGLDLCRAVRARWTKTPVLFLTANATSRDVVDAFAGGADDYVVKPFRAPELGARIFGLLRRTSAAR
jgi:two-component system phosphate regulon response regulator PhoB